MNDFIENILASKKNLVADVPYQQPDPVEEGGCGVVGFSTSIPVSGRHIFEPSVQMHNRGNGKGGGIACAGLVAEQMGIDKETLKNDYLLQIALLDPSVQDEVEKSFISPDLEIHHKQVVDHIADHRSIGLEVCPPDIVRYFVRVKKESLERFIKDNNLADAPRRSVEDEFIYQNSFKLNQRFYASLGDKQAFVMSHARDLMIFKIVGYAEQVVQYYKLDDTKAHVWIAHQRYPTKGRVWHPAGAHPFIGMNEALVHNGDFANYYSISEYLRQHNVVPQFLTDTEVAALLFDMLHRTYGYPVEYVIEALAPTTELDFDQLPEEKKDIYRTIQAMHMHGSPDGPWFFIIARSNPDQAKYQLLGITDTAMLRPQVFALQQGDVSVGLVGSEKQAIDATLKSLSEDDPRFRPVADKYWNARGGSHTDGGSFGFTVDVSNGDATMICTDKFGKQIDCPEGQWVIEDDANGQALEEVAEKISKAAKSGDIAGLFEYASSQIASWSFGQVRSMTAELEKVAQNGSEGFNFAIHTLAMLNDRHYDCGKKKRSVVLQLIREAINSILDSVPSIAKGKSDHACRIDWDSRKQLRAPKASEKTLVIYAYDFEMEGDNCDAWLLVKAYQLGWKKFIVYGLKGQRFHGCGLGPATEGVRIDIFGSNGDYLASGIDGMEIHVHDNAQDQLCQIMKAGTVVIHGDVGQTFMYGAKGGEVYVKGNAAGRPLINAVGRPRVVINGTCLDFLAESFMAGDPHNGGGFVILNGIEFDDKGKTKSQQTPYPGANLFSLASGGAIFVRDPHKQLVDDQLNGGVYQELTEKDWQLMLPYLEANERHFGISIKDNLLTVEGKKMEPKEVYRKVVPVKLAVLAKEEIPE